MLKWSRTKESTSSSSEASIKPKPLNKKRLIYTSSPSINTPQQQQNTNTYLDDTNSNNKVLEGYNINTFESSSNSKSNYNNNYKKLPQNNSNNRNNSTNNNTSNSNNTYNMTHTNTNNLSETNISNNYNLLLNQNSSDNIHHSTILNSNNIDNNFNNFNSTYNNCSLGYADEEENERVVTSSITVSVKVKTTTLIYYKPMKV